MTANNLFVVEDEQKICEFVEHVAASDGFAVRTCSTLAGLRALFDDMTPTLILLDLNLADQDGIEILRFLREVALEARVLLMSGEGLRVLESASQLGKELGLHMSGVLEKPIDLDTLEIHLYRNWQGPWQVTEDEIARALAERQFVAHYQPIIQPGRDDIWRVSGVEALARWHHPRGGPVGPDRFMATVEKMDVLDQLTESILEQTVQAAQSWWRHQGLDLAISVNIPAGQLLDLNLPDKLLALLRAHDFAAERLVLDVTERGTMIDAATATDVLTRCRLKRFNIALDDFGTGYSSLTHLCDLPFSQLKIDASFVSSALASENSRIVIRSCIALGHSLGLTVCAEGVENHATLDLLDELGCDQAQGRFIGAPTTASDVLAIAHNFRYRRVREQP